MLIIDRFEGDFAVVEHGEERLEIKRNLIRGKANEGDVLIECDGVYAVDSEATAKRRAEVLSVIRRLR